MGCRPLESVHSMGAVDWPRWPFQHRCPSTVSHSPTDARSSKVNDLAVRHPNIAGAAAVLAACRRGVVRTTDELKKRMMNPMVNEMMRCTKYTVCTVCTVIMSSSLFR